MIVLIITEFKCLRISPTLTKLKAESSKMLTVYFSFIFVILIFFYLIKNLRKHKNFPPGPPKLPVWGSYWFMLKESYNHPHLAFEILAKRYKTDILGVYLGDYPCVITMSHELCKEMLNRDEFIGRNDTVIIRARNLNELKGIFFSDGDFWREQRRFSLRHMRDYGFGRRSHDVENFVSHELRSFIEFLQQEPNQETRDICRKRGEILLPDAFYSLLLNSILQVLASTRFDDYELREIARAGLRFQRSGDATGAAVSMTPWLRFIAPDFFGYTSAIKDNGYMLDFLKNIIDEHVRTYSEDCLRDFIDVYINENIKTQINSQFDYNQLLLTVLDYMFPAAIAIGHTLNFYFAYLINNPHVQVKIQEEIDRVVGQSRLPNLDDRILLSYTEASIREGIRIFPINPLGIPRRCTQDTTLAGYSIPKDTIMLPCIWTAHKDEKVWETPEMFLPERFLDTNGYLLKKDHTMGFGNGRRLCAGETFARQNMFLIVSGLLQNFTLRSWNGKSVDLNSIVPGVNLSLDNNWVQFIPK